MLAALVLTATGNTHSTSKSNTARKQKSQSAASVKSVSHHAAEVDAETFTGTNVTDENMDMVQENQDASPKHKALKKSSKLFPGTNAAQKQPPALNALGNFLKQAGNRAENAISKTFKGGVNKKNPAKKNKAKGKGGAGGSVQPLFRGGGGTRKTTTLNPDYSDIEVDENGNPVVLNETDIPEELDADPKSANQTSESQLEDFPPYGGEYTDVEEGPVSYPDENPRTPPKKNNKKPKGVKKNRGKKGGNKKVNINKKKKKNQKKN